MNNFLLNQLMYNLDVDDRMEFISKCNKLILNNEIYTKETYKICNIELTFNLLLSICDFYVNSSSKNHPSLEKRLKILKLNRLYFLALITLSEKEKQDNKILINNLYKEYYDICEKCNWNEENLKKARKNAKIIDNTSNEKFTFSEIVILNENRVEQILEYGSFYAKEMLNKNRNKKVRQIINSYKYNFFDMILNEKDENKIIEYLILNHKTININELKIQIPSFIQNYSIVQNINDKEKLNKIEKELEFKLDTTISIMLEKINSRLNREKKVSENYLEQQAKEKENKVEKYITMFLEGDYRSIKHFCREFHISITTFKEYVNYLKTTNIELYEKVSEKISLLDKMKKRETNQELEKIVMYVKNGIQLEDGTTREFDILDCYELTNIPLIGMRNLLNKSNLSYEDLKTIREFINKYRNCSPTTTAAIYKEKDILIINEKPYEVSKIEKDIVFKYLEMYQIPLLNVTYNLALKKLLQGKLNLSTDIKTLKK